MYGSLNSLTNQQSTYWAHDVGSAGFPVLVTKTCPTAEGENPAAPAARNSGKDGIIMINAWIINKYRLPTRTHQLLRHFGHEPAVTGYIAAVE